MRFSKPTRAAFQVFILALVLLTSSCAPPAAAPIPPPESSLAPSPPAVPTNSPVPIEPTAAPALPGSSELPLSQVAQSNLARNTSPDVSADELSQLVAGNTAFALDFYQSVRGQAGNLFYSPHSLSLALAMTYAGARSATAAQMAEALHFTLPPEQLHPAFNTLALELEQRGQAVEADQRFTLNIANSIWGQQGYKFLPEFLDLLALNYGSGLRLVDYASDTEAARQAINEWISEQTAGKIQDLIPPGAVDGLTRLVLANAIYFKAGWLQPFSKDRTQEGTFQLLDGSQVKVPMMRHPEPKRLLYAQGQGYQAVELPYAGDTSSMVILVPDAGNFPDFEAALTSDQLSAILSTLESQTVALTLPKFTFQSNYALADTLSQLGMADAFDPTSADFSGMDGTQDLYITNVIHKAFVAVDEAGTEAAAATAVIVGVESMPMVEIELAVDRPFIFLIRDRPTGAVLFFGRVLNPAG